MLERMGGRGRRRHAITANNSNSMLIAHPLARPPVSSARPSVVVDSAAAALAMLEAAAAAAAAATAMADAVSVSRKFS